MTLILDELPLFILQNIIEIVVDELSPELRSVYSNVPDTCTFAITITQVSRRLREAALFTPKLWSTLASSYNLSNDGLEAFLARSGNPGPGLKITFDFRSPGPEVFILTVWRHRLKWKEIRIISPLLEIGYESLRRALFRGSNDGPGESVGIDATLLSLPMLEQAHFVVNQHANQSVSGEAFGMKHWMTPSLRRFASFNILPCSHTVQTLRELDLMMPKEAMRDLPELLAGCKLLAKLSLTLCRIYPGESVLSSRAVAAAVTLPRLTAFKIALTGGQVDRSPLLPLAYINAPQLECLAVSGPLYEPYEALAFKEVVDLCAEKNPRHLEFECSQRSLRTDPIDVGYTLQTMPDLETLGIVVDSSPLLLPRASSILPLHFKLQELGFQGKGSYSKQVMDNLISLITSAPPVLPGLRRLGLDDRVPLDDKQALLAAAPGSLVVDNSFYRGCW